MTKNFIRIKGFLVILEMVGDLKIKNQSRNGYERAAVSQE